MPSSLFSNSVFSSSSLTQAIRLFPNEYGRLEQLKLMPGQGVRTVEILVEELLGSLALLPTGLRGAPGTVGKQGGRTLRKFKIPHISHDDSLYPDDVQDVRAFGQENALMSMSELLAAKLQTMRSKHAITLEHLRMGALKGIILDADGSTLYNLFDEFEITAKTINFELGTATTDVRAKCIEALRHIEDNLKGLSHKGVRALVSAEFFDALVNHAGVQGAYERWNDGAALRDDMRTGFLFGGITFEEYRGQCDDPDGTTRRFIAAGEGHAFPEGAGSLFKTYLAPADFNEAANKPGMELYAKQEPREFNRGINIHTQSNPLPMCHRPGVLVKFTAS